MNTFRSLIDLWPSLGELAKDSGQSYETVCKWRQRDSIPAIHWMTIIQAAKKRHIYVSAESLASMMESKAA